MAWDDAVVTFIGNSMLEQSLSGTPVYIDFAQGGSGTVPPAALMAQTSLVDLRQKIPLASSEDTDEGRKIGCLITNEKLDQGYQLQQLGIWARSGDGEPALFAIVQDAQGFPIPSRHDLPEFTFTFYALVKFIPGDGFVVSVDPSTLVTFAALSAAMGAHDSAEGAHSALFDAVSGALTAHASSAGAHSSLFDAVSAALAAHASGAGAHSALFAAREPTIRAGAQTDYYRGDKTWQRLNATAVGIDPSRLIERPLAEGANVHTWIPFGPNGAGLFSCNSRGNPNAPDQNHWRYIGLGHANTAGYITLLAMPFVESSNRLLVKTCNAGVWSGWIEMLNTGKIVTVAQGGTGVTRLEGAPNVGLAGTLFPKHITFGDVLADGGISFALTGANWLNNGYLPVKGIIDALRWEYGMSYAYRCTGTDDDLAIQNIVNAFLNYGTAMTMKLTITGTMGLQANPANGRQIDLFSGNHRGAVCHLDFSGCEIPKITTLYRDFLVLRSGVTVNVVGLSVETSQRGIVILENSGGNSFSKCVIKSLNPGIHYGEGVVLHGIGYNRFDSCTISADGGASTFVCGMNSQSRENVFVNCTIRGIGTNSGPAVSGAGIFFHGGVTGTCFIGCKIVSINFNGAMSGGLFIDGGAMGHIAIDNCYIWAANMGLYVSSANTNAEIKLTNCKVISGTRDAYQTTPVNTVRWHVSGNSFSKPNILIDGAELTHRISASTYVPEHANWFLRTSE